MTNILTKSAALDLARQSVKLQAEALRSTGKDAAEVAKFEAMANAIVAKGEGLDDAFFAAIPFDINNGVLRNGVSIVRAINNATKG